MSYFRTWANPTRLMIFSYCEGDKTLKEAASPEEFAAELREIDAWNLMNGYCRARIDELPPENRTVTEVAI